MRSGTLSVRNRAQIGDKGRGGRETMVERKKGRREGKESRARVDNIGSHEQRWSKIALTRTYGLEEARTDAGSTLH